MTAKPNYKNLIKRVEESYLRDDLPDIKVGDSVSIGLLIQEGDKKRVQTFEGIVISKSNTGLNRTITLRKILANGGLERVFILNSPQIKTISILRSSVVRRAKLYYLRERSGKSARLKQSL